MSLIKSQFFNEINHLDIMSDEDLFCMATQAEEHVLYLSTGKNTNSTLLSERLDNISGGADTTE